MKQKRRSKQNNTLSGVTTGIFRNKKKFSHVIPDGFQHLLIRVPKKYSLHARDGDRVTFRIVRHRQKQGTLAARIMKIYDAPATFIAEKKRLPEKFNIPTAFSKQVIEASKKTADRRGERGRIDLTGTRCITIDPADAKDFDDAVSLEYENGVYELGVYISDVSYYVREKTLLDREAFERGFSIYLPWGVVPMLPKAISENLCSLREGKKRLAVACCLKINQKGEILESTFFRCVIVNKKRLDYKGAYEILTGKQDADGWLKKMLTLMQTLAEILRNKRLDEGSLDFELPELKVEMDEQGLPGNIKPLQKYVTNDMIEEFMLCANRAVAVHLAGLDTSALYRVHDRPDPTLTAGLVSFLKASNISIRETGNQAAGYKEIIDSVRRTKLEKTVNIMLLRSVPKACYSTENRGHFGLNFKVYTHFTSPVRRYPDLLVHRLLLKKPKKRDKGTETSHEALKNTAYHASRREENVLKVERDAVALAGCMFLFNKTGSEYWGTVTGIIEAGVFIELDGLGIDGMIHISRLGRGLYYYDPLTIAMKGVSSNKKIKIGDRMHVRLDKVNIALRRIDLVPTE
jgi:ribonuclease R